MPAPLLPPYLYLDATAPASLPSFQANLMPFHIDYTGPAPIDTFLVLRPASPSPDSPDDPAAAADDDEKKPAQQETSYVSAFRGRRIQSTQLVLPPGYVGKLVHLTTTTTPSSAYGSTSPSTDTQGAPVPKRPKLSSPSPRTTAAVAPHQPKLALKPVKMQKFSMDSDDDADDAGEGDEAAREEAMIEYEEQVAAAAQAARVQLRSNGLAPTAEEGGVQEREQEEEGEEEEQRQVLTPLAALQDGAIRVWGPDGPVDRGDDAWFRFLDEWVGVVANELHAP
ncbi:hypothetical protein ACQY0O_003821 [Thecaphora frezii]